MGCEGVSSGFVNVAWRCVRVIVIVRACARPRRVTMSRRAIPLRERASTTVSGVGCWYERGLRARGPPRVSASLHISGESTAAGRASALLERPCPIRRAALFVTSVPGHALMADPYGIRDNLWVEDTARKRTFLPLRSCSGACAHWPSERADIGCRLRRSQAGRWRSHRRDSPWPFSRSRDGREGRARAVSAVHMPGGGAAGQERAAAEGGAQSPLSVQS
jgi:hypothetical protein